MDQIIINEEKCVGCSLCVDDCPNSCLWLENGKAHFGKPACIECGHCYAICPQGAIRLSDYRCEDEPVVPMTALDSDTLFSAMRSRRTIRHFTPQPVEEEKLRKILEVGRYSPTGGNFQGVSFTVLGSRQAEAEAICTDIFRNGDKLGAGPAVFLKKIDVRVTDDFFFKGAPLVIVVSGADDVNPALASSYMEIMAESLGLGVLYSGFFCECARVSEKLRELLELPERHRVVTCMVIGYPSVQYRRIVPRKALKVKML
jgi:nitroreductase/NAD-dependent dihydropyrimidine dehydrogenase PreA subunit